MRKKNPPTWTVYILRAKNGALYTGITTNLERRFQEHSGKSNKGTRGAKFFRTSPPEALLCAVRGFDLSSALKIEHRIKKLSRERKLTLVKKANRKILERLIKTES